MQRDFLEEFLPSIAEENGWELDLVSWDDVVGIITLASRSCSEKTRMSRWFGWNEVQSRWNSLWTAMLALLTYMNASGITCKGE